jgi:hypothetical protein
MVFIILNNEYYDMYCQISAFNLDQRLTCQEEQGRDGPEYYRFPGPCTSRLSEDRQHGRAITALGLSIFTGINDDGALLGNRALENILR